MLATQIQDVYDAFFAKIEFDFTGKESLVYQFFKAANGYAYKTVPENLEYTITDNEDYTGNYTETLSQETIELIALYMKREYLEKIIAKFEGQRNIVGTKDFGKLGFRDQYVAAMNGKKRLADEIEKFRQEFYSYANN